VYLAIRHAPKGVSCAYTCARRRPVWGVEAWCNLLQAVQCKLLKLYAISHTGPNVYVCLRAGAPLRAHELDAISHTRPCMCTNTCAQAASLGCTSWTRPATSGRVMHPPWRARVWAVCLTWRGSTCLGGSRAAGGACARCPCHVMSRHVMPCHVPLRVCGLRCYLDLMARVRKPSGAAALAPALVGPALLREHAPQARCAWQAMRAGPIRSCLLMTTHHTFVRVDDDPSYMCHDHAASCSCTYARGWGDGACLCWSLVIQLKPRYYMPSRACAPWLGGWGPSMSATSHALVIKLSHAIKELFMPVAAPPGWANQAGPRRGAPRPAMATAAAACWRLWQSLAP